MSEFWFLHLPMLTILGIAVTSDLISRRIPNWLVAVGLIAGLACNGLINVFPEFRGIGFILALSGAVVALACLLPLYVLGALGAGDVKLMAAVGAFLGPWQTLGAVLLTLLAGGVLSLAAALASRSLGQALTNLRLMLHVVMTPKGSGIALGDVQTTGRLPYALAIAAGAGLQLWLAAHGGWPFK